MGPIRSKVIEVKGQICFFCCPRSKVIEVKGQIYVVFFLLPQVLGPILTKLGGKVGSNFCISAVLGPICMKLGECIQADP